MGCHYPKALLRPFSNPIQSPSGVTQSAEPNSTLMGVDVSTWQGTINWDYLKTAKDFCIMRSTYGNGSTDDQFHANQSGARRVGILRGYYHYSYPQYNSATAEADWFLSVIGTPQTGEILMLDFEESYSDPPTWCKAFLDRVYSRIGIKPWLYLNYSQTNSYNWTSIINAGYPLSLADYDDNPNPSTPSTKWGFNANKQVLG